ncbi:MULTISPECIES: cytochrome C oxidase subunit IV family protein [Pseudomonas]|uniref:Cytochrome C oxidase subunit IV family protein n=1 Tax=Pseudomonas donghuensis TaxID=1163398 RepID=A0AAP0XCV2_9PSED|nr:MULTISPECIES: cytochrome C oxidase subunit IV family protein [Pseudomonas]KDN99087.1 cytochrome C oxidase subunit IV family protein [Pseudomonas donghuensis]MBS7600935.1 cytochrome C oxidase subunit IV family protein [Pseudomonas sp. RC2C2]MCP6691168.1 cytochrome C oxidase subunit IV family protein [Pseudomonas donghuensis]MDF9893270.1 membrane-associated phospholipid phosphatase [Pseudomonas vranovensis]
MPTSIFLLLCWLALTCLSLGTVMLGQGALILLLAVAKAWLITDGFMELRHGPQRWRWLLLSWALVLAALVGLSLVANT